MQKLAALGLSLTLCVAGAFAATPSAAEEHSFKRIGVPKPGQAGKRIMVQIAIGAPMFPDAPRPPPVPGQPGDAVGAGVSGGAGGFDWFWAVVSPSIYDVGASRFIDAVAALDKAPDGQGLTGPRLQALQQIADAHGRTILNATIGTRVSPALVLAVIAVESGGRADAVSGAGATGLMQLMPDTASRFGVTDATDPDANIKGGVAYLNWLMEEFGGDAVLALAGYNAGEGAVRKASGVPEYNETRGYVPKVLAAWKVARGLCLTPPDLPGDGCVFTRRTAGG